MDPKTSESSVHRLAGRLANTGRVLRSWADAMDSRDPLLTQRLRRASRDLMRAVEALSVSDREFEQSRGAADLLDSGLIDTPSSGPFGLRGHSEMISLAEFVASLASMGKSGLLQVQSSCEEFVIELVDGSVAYVEGKRSPVGERIGEVLMRRGAIDAEQLALGLAEQHLSELFGESLLRQGLVTEEELRAGLVEAALLTFRRIHEVGAGFDFHFEEGTSVTAAIPTRLGVSYLLLESARMLDEERRDNEAALLPRAPAAHMPGAAPAAALEQLPGTERRT